MQSISIQRFLPALVPTLDFIQHQLAIQTMGFEPTAWIMSQTPFAN